MTRKKKQKTKKFIHTNAQSEMKEIIQALEGVVNYLIKRLTVTRHKKLTTGIKKRRKLWRYNKTQTVLTS